MHHIQLLKAGKSGVVGHRFDEKLALSIAIGKAFEIEANFRADGLESSCHFHVEYLTVVNDIQTRVADPRFRAAFVDGARVLY
jgi:hypothetical protein